MQTGRTGGRRRQVLLWLIAAGAMSQGPITLAQTQYQQDPQFPAPSAQFNFRK
jgi:hypothetical protein